MIFSYKTYWDTTFILPVAVIIIMLVLLFSSSYGYWIKSIPKRRTISETLGYIFCLLIVVCCLVSQCKYLINGGIQLLGEREEDAHTHTGIIESVCEPSERFPGFKSSHSHGADIVIDGEQYFAITCGDFKEGECVTVHYLPNSHFVLSIFLASSD